jgi:hypothetical protein
MAATPRNPSSAGFLPVMDDFPAGSAGMQFFHSEFAAAFVHDGTRWRTQDGGAGVYTAAMPIEPRMLVRLADAGLELLDLPALAGHPSPRATGLSVAVVGDDVLVRWEGEVDGFVDLTEGATYCAGAEPGELVYPSDPDLPLLRVGVARSSTRFYVHLDQPILM